MKMLVVNFTDTISVIAKAIENAKLLGAHQFECKEAYKIRAEEQHSRRSAVYRFFFDADYDKFNYFFKTHKHNVERLQSLLDRLIPMEAETQNEFILEEQEIDLITRYAFLNATQLQEMYANELAFWEI
jgi:hypothetical protein